MIIRFTDCSGNGDPIIAPKCEAECNCSGGWEGEFCERLIANGGGDPHLETLDGKQRRKTDSTFTHFRARDKEKFKNSERDPTICPNDRFQTILCVFVCK